MTTYNVTLWDADCKMGDDTILADSVGEARILAEEWAKDGSYDHPGTVDVQLTGHEVDERWSVSVG